MCIWHGALGFRISAYWLLGQEASGKGYRQGLEINKTSKGGCWPLLLLFAVDLQPNTDAITLL